MLTQDARLQRRLAHRRRVRRRRLGLIVLLLIALAAGLFLGLRGGGKAASAPPRTTRAKSDVTRSQTATGHGGTRKITRLSLPTTLPARTLDVPILMYHRIDMLKPGLPAITRGLTVAPSDFAAQMRWLHAHGYHTITQLQLFDALEHAKALPAKPILITFDDGYRDVWLNAARVLRRLGMHATAYVITNRVSGSDPFDFLSWKQLRDLEKDGFDIGSHTLDHAELPPLTDPEALHELIQSRHTLEVHLGHPVQWFAYPAGKFDARTEALVGQAGYVLAVTTDPGSAQSAKAPFALHRFEILDTTGVSGLASLLGS